MSVNIKYIFDEKVISDLSIERYDTINYYKNCLGYLLQTLKVEKKLEESYVFTEALLLNNHFYPYKAEQNPVIADIYERLHYIATIGKALFFINGNLDGQLKKELLRFENPNDRIGTWYLFHFAGELACNGYTISLIPERNNKTPDFSATKNGRTIYIEANAKQPRSPVDNPLKIQQMIQKIIEEKRQKFTDPKFWPGAIVADISPASYLVNEQGLPPVFELHESYIKADRGSLFTQSKGPNGISYLPSSYEYLICEDTTFFNRSQNNGNFLHYLSKEFSQINLHETQIIQCVLSATRHALRNNNVITFMKGHQLMVRQGYQHLALKEICPHRYII